MLEVKEIQSITEYNYQKELLRIVRKFSFGGNKDEMNSWIYQEICRQKWQFQVGSRQGGTSRESQERNQTAAEHVLQQKGRKGFQREFCSGDTDTGNKSMLIVLKGRVKEEGKA